MQSRSAAVEQLLQPEAFHVPHAAVGASCSIAHTLVKHHLSTIVTPDPWAQPLVRSGQENKGLSFLLSTQLCEGEQRLELALKPSQLNLFMLRPCGEEVLASEGLWEKKAVAWW